MSTAKAKCGNCRFFSRYGEPEQFGDCRFSAPRLKFADAHLGTGDMAVWPSVEEDEWCGVHEWNKLTELEV